MEENREWLLETHALKMWNYYGSKSKVVLKYPAPSRKLIIEPFAGSARYALQYWENDVILVDAYKVIADLWKWLQKCSPGDIDRLPRLKAGQTLDSFTWDCDEARNLVGFTNGFALYEPRYRPSPHRIVHRPGQQNYRLNQIAKDLHKIRHWRIYKSDYRRITNYDATWFIDPPYQFGGHYYKHGNKGFNFQELKAWIEQRNGERIVCENEKATWMNFKPLVSFHGSGLSKLSHEYINHSFK